MMDLKEVKRRVKQIEDMKTDAEGAHVYEDALYMDVLQSIVDNTCEDTVACAKAALVTQKIDFTRWYA